MKNKKLLSMGIVLLMSCAINAMQGEERPSQEELFRARSAHILIQHIEWLEKRISAVADQERAGGDVEYVANEGTYLLMLMAHIVNECVNATETFKEDAEYGEAVKELKENFKQFRCRAGASVSSWQATLVNKEKLTVMPIKKSKD